MTKVTILPFDLAEAKRKAKEMGSLRNSILKGEGNVYGFLGENIVAKFIGATIENTFDYDLIKDGVTIDVKTKRCTSEPRADYECSIHALEKKQRCDYYVFTRILKDLSTCWILGAIKKEDYFEQAAFCKEGAVDPKSNQGWTFKADCYNLPISQLKPLRNQR